VQRKFEFDLVINDQYLKKFYSFSQNQQSDINLYKNFMQKVQYKLLYNDSDTQFILIINQLDAQNLFYSKFISCLYMFRAPCGHRQEVKIILYSLWYHHAYRWPSHAQVERGIRYTYYKKELHLHKDLIWQTFQCAECVKMENYQGTDSRNIINLSSFLKRKIQYDILVK
jgi:hypothetical protein